MRAAVSRRSAAAPSGLARGTMTIESLSSSGRSSPSASAFASASIASPPAGSLPCCWPISHTIGRPVARIACGLGQTLAREMRIGSGRPCGVVASVCTTIGASGRASFRMNVSSSACEVERGAPGRERRRVEADGDVGVAGQHLRRLPVAIAHGDRRRRVLGLPPRSEPWRARDNSQRRCSRDHGAIMS